MDLKSTVKNLQWVEKYRPEKLSDLILPDTLYNFIEDVLKGESKFTDFCLFGPPGTGKSTTAKMIVKTLNAEYMWINASQSGENGVESVNRIHEFMQYQPAPTKFKVKYVVLDEFDYMTPNAMAALRGIMELLPEHISFILTCNYLNKVPDNLLSRARPIEFGYWLDKSNALKKFTKRCIEILKLENIKIKNIEKSIIYFKKFLPDFRSALNELQILSSMYKKEIDFEVLVNTSEFKIGEAITELEDIFRDKNKLKFKEFRQWVSNNEKLFMMMNSLEPVISSIFEKVDILFEEDMQRAEAILLLHKYIVEEKQVLNKILCITSLITELVLLKLR